MVKEALPADTLRTVSENTTNQLDATVDSLSTVFGELEPLGFRINGFPKYHSFSANTEPPELKEGENFMIFGIVSDVDIPQFIGFPSSGVDIVRKSSGDVLMAPALVLDAKLQKGRHRMKMHLAVNTVTGVEYELTMATTTQLEPASSFSLRDLPLPLKSAGFQYDFRQNPQSREMLAELARLRLPTMVFPGDIYYRSLLVGHESPEGFDANLRVYLQNPNPQNHLKCYEVELFRGQEKNLPITTEVAPE